MTRDGVPQALTEALRALRTVITRAGYPLPAPSAGAARASAAELVAQLDDYLLPRLSRLDAPLLVVVGGSTGAGKSTLVNSLVRAPVSAAGVLRPTTRAPVLVCHPHDTPWFRRGDLLPGLTRTSSPADALPDSRHLLLVAAPALTPGVAFLDAPDIDSVVDANRALATQLLAAADLWLFVTTAARYADAVPWQVLRTARDRGTAIALVLDRVPHGAADEVFSHLSELLAGHGLGQTPLFVLPEIRVDGQGLLPEPVIAGLRDWFRVLAADAQARGAVVRQTLDGAIGAVQPVVERLATALEDQVAAGEALAELVGEVYGSARSAVEHGVGDGTLLRGEVLGRWQEFVGGGEWSRSLQATVGRWRDRAAAAVTGRAAPARDLSTVVESGLVTLVRGAATDAADQAYAAWRGHPVGAALLTPELAHPSPDLVGRTEQLVREWQGRVFELVSEEGAGKRVKARNAAYAVNVTGLLVMVGVFASTALIPTGAELAVAGGTALASQKVLEAIFGDQAIRDLTRRARRDLLEGLGLLLDAEASRYLDRLTAVPVADEAHLRLRAAARQVAEARAAAQLNPTVGPPVDPAPGAAAYPAAHPGLDPPADTGADPPPAAAVPVGVSADPGPTAEPSSSDYVEEIR